MSMQGLGAIAQGINQGLNLKQQDDLLAEQKALREQNQSFQQEQRQQWQLQTQRANKDADALEAAKAGASQLPAVGSVKAQRTVEGPAPVAADGSSTVLAGPGAPMQQVQRVTEADNTRALANLWRQVDPLKATDLDKLARQQTMEQAANELQTLRAGARSMGLADYARAVGALVHGDDSPLGVSNITPSADGKSVRATVFNRQHGLARDLDFTSHDQITDLAMAHYDPAGYRAMKAKEADYAARAAEKLAENPVISVPGGYVERKTGKFVRTAQFGNGVPVYDDSGNVIGYQAGRGGAGGGGAGKKPGEPDLTAGFNEEKAYEQATKFVDTLRDADVISPEQRAHRIQSRVGALRQVHTEAARANFFTDQAERILRSVASDPRKYADQYEKARAAGGDAVLAELARRGLKAPGAPLLTAPRGLNPAAR